MRRNEITDLSPLSEMKFENIFNMSRTDNGYYFYNIMKTVRFDPKELDSNYYFKFQVDRHMSWTSMSYRFYNTIDLWWIICVVNNIDNPVAFPTPGTTLKIIKKSQVSTIVSSIKTQLQ